MGGKRDESAKGTSNFNNLLSKRTQVGHLQQQPIAIDTDPESATCVFGTLNQDLALVYQLCRL
jgi:hypothetical protein